MLSNAIRLARVAAVGLNSLLDFLYFRAGLYDTQAMSRFVSDGPRIATGPNDSRHRTQSLLVDERNDGKCRTF